LFIHVFSNWLAGRKKTCSQIGQREKVTNPNHKLWSCLI